MQFMGVNQAVTSVTYYLYNYYIPKIIQICSYIHMPSGHGQADFFLL